MLWFGSWIIRKLECKLSVVCWKAGPDTWLPTWGVGSTALLPMAPQAAAVAAGVSGSTLQDLQDRNDELLAALEGLRAQLPSSWHGRPHAQPEEQLLPGHGPAGRSPVLGGDRLCAPTLGDQRPVAMGVCLPSQHKLPPWPRHGMSGFQRITHPSAHHPWENGL